MVEIDPVVRGWADAYAHLVAQPALHPADIEALLEAAATAAHASARQSAPLTTYLAGRAGLDAQQAAELAEHLAAQGA